MQYTGWSIFCSTAAIQGRRRFERYGAVAHIDPVTVPAAITLPSVLLNRMLTCGLSVVVIWPVSTG